MTKNKGNKEEQNKTTSFSSLGDNMQRQSRIMRKYTWVGNSIAEEDMTKMYAIKSEKKIPITKQVSDAVKQYLANKAT